MSRAKLSLVLGGAAIFGPTLVIFLLGSRPASTPRKPTAAELRVDAQRERDALAAAATFVSDEAAAELLACLRKAADSSGRVATAKVGACMAPTMVDYYNASTAAPE